MVKGEEGRIVHYTVRLHHGQGDTRSFDSSGNLEHASNVYVCGDFLCLLKGFVI